MLRILFATVALTLLMGCRPPQLNPGNGKPGESRGCVGPGCKPDFSVTIYKDGRVTADNINEKFKNPMNQSPTGDMTLAQWLSGLFSPESLAGEKPIDGGGGGASGNGGSGGGSGTGSGSEGTGLGVGSATGNQGPGSDNPADDPCFNGQTDCQDRPTGGDFKNSEVGKVMNFVWETTTKGWDEITGANHKKRREAKALNRRYAEMQALQDQANAVLSDINTGSDSVMAVVRELSDQDKYDLTANTFAQTKNVVAVHNRRSSLLDQETSDIEGPVQVPSTKKTYDTPDLKAVEQARLYRNYVSRQVEDGPESFKPVGRQLIGIADNALDYSEEAYRSGDKEKGDFARNLAVSVLDITLSLTPGVGLMKDIYEASMGKSVLTGEKLSNLERTMAFVGVLTFGYGSALKLATKAGVITDILKAGKAAEEGAEIYRAGAKATEIAETAEKIGLKDKRVIDEIANSVKESLPCKVALIELNLPTKFFDLIVGTAYAGNCIPEGGEDAVKATLESFGTDGAKALPKMTPAQVSRSTKIDNTIRDHAKPLDFEGVKKELAGERIPDGKGGYFDHITEMKEAKAGLEKHSGALKDSLKNPNLDSDVRAFLDHQVNRAESVASKMADTLAGKL